MNIRPLHDRVIVKRKKVETKSAWRHRSRPALQRLNPPAAKCWLSAMAVSLKMASEAAGCESWRHRYFQRWLRCEI